MEKTITVNIYYTGTNGNARAFAEKMESGGTADAIRAEKGNLRYEYFFPMGDSETVPGCRQAEAGRVFASLQSKLVTRTALPFLRLHSRSFLRSLCSLRNACGGALCNYNTNKKLEPCKEK